MSSRRYVLLGLLAHMVTVGSLYAQAVDFLGAGGISIPTGDYNDIAKLGWHATAGVRIARPKSPLGLQIDASYGHFALDASGAGGSFDVGQRFIFGTADLVYQFQSSASSRIRPYALGGVGAYNSKGTGRDAGLFGATSSTTDFGLNAGAGFGYVVGGATFFLEGRFHDIFSDPSNTQFVSVTVGVRVGG
jgi:Outer membrane protein beta-barrel domain